MCVFQERKLNDSLTQGNGISAGSPASFLPSPTMRD
ncbi:hypothetical protein EL75_4861 [Escherichia coli]|nr:hypothetical protein EL75_4861 [Escherichia coli]